MIARGDIYWVDLGPAVGSRPAGRRPVLVVQTHGYNVSGLATAVAASITSNLALAAAPGNVLLPATASGLPRDSVVNVTQLSTLNKADLGYPAGRVPPWLMQNVSAGLRGVLLPEREASSASLREEVAHLAIDPADRAEKASILSGAGAVAVPARELPAIVEEGR